MSSKVERMNVGRRMDECATGLGVVLCVRQRRQCEMCSVNPTERAESKLFQQSERASERQRDLDDATSSSVKVHSLRNVQLYFTSADSRHYDTTCTHDPDPENIL